MGASSCSIAEKEQQQKETEELKQKLNKAEEHLASQPPAAPTAPDSDLIKKLKEDMKAAEQTNQKICRRRRNTIKQKLMNTANRLWSIRPTWQIWKKRRKEPWKPSKTSLRKRWWQQDKIHARTGASTFTDWQSETNAYEQHHHPETKRCRSTRPETANASAGRKYGVTWH